FVRHVGSTLPPNIQMEPTRPAVRVIMSLRRAAHLERWADSGNPISPMTTTKIIGIVFVAGLPLFLLLLIASFRLFDELLRVPFSDVHSEWERCDSPSGYFWKPPGSRHLSLRRRGDLWSHWYWY